MGAALQLSVTLTSIDCGQCGGTYAINERFRKECYDQGRSWTCPYCQTGWGYSETEIDRLKKQLQNKEEARRRAVRDREHSERVASAYKGHYTRARKMVGSGQCPVRGCRRHFKNLASHMVKQHPEYADAEVAS